MQAGLRRSKGAFEPRENEEIKRLDIYLCKVEEGELEKE